MQEPILSKHFAMLCERHGLAVDMVFKFAKLPEMHESILNGFHKLQHVEEGARIPMNGFTSQSRLRDWYSYTGGKISRT